MVAALLACKIASVEAEAGEVMLDKHSTMRDDIFPFEHPELWSSSQRDYCKVPIGETLSTVTDILFNMSGPFDP